MFLLMENYDIIETKKLNVKSRNNIVNLVHETFDKNKQILVFNNSKSSSEKTAVEIANSITTWENREELEILSNKILKALSTPTKQCQKLASIVKKGIAFHHSGLVSKQRTLIEGAFKSGLIKLISSTPTLAAGLNLPAYKVIIKDYKRYSQRGFADIPVLEFHQMSGRAGRPGQEEIGKAVINVKSDDEVRRIVPKYIFGEPEEIISKLAVEPILKMYLLSLISMNFVNTKEEIFNFFSSTLYAFQYKDIEAFKFNLLKLLDVLREYDFIEQDDDYYVATQIGKKFSQLYLNPDTAHYFYSNVDKFIDSFTNKHNLNLDYYPLIYFIVNTAEMRPLFSIYKVESEYYLKRAEEVVDSIVVGYDPYEMDYDSFLKNIKCSDMLFDWIEEAHDDYINEKYKVTPGELRYKLDVVDWLLYCIEEIALMKKNFYFKNLISKLRTRFKKGVKDELLLLTSFKGVGRARARKLFNGGFRKILDLKKASIDSLANIVGESIAISIKKQLDEDLRENNLLKELEKPRQIRQREVKEEEINALLESEKNYEKELQEKQKGLLSYF
jgi:helicase